MRAAWLACALLCAFAAHPLGAQPAEPHAPPRWGQFGDIVFHHRTADTGLPFTGATAIAQDRHGFLWVGSQSGLARWDGQRFRLYQAADGHSGLRDNLVKVLHVDGRGRLWVGTNAGGIARYDPAADRFFAFGAGPRGLSHAGVRAIEDDGRGGLWVGTSGGLDRVDPDARTIRHYRPAPGRLPDGKVSALLRGGGGRLWVGTAAGLALLDPATGLFRPVPLRKGEPPGISALAGDAGGVWIGTVGAGAFRLDTASGTARPVLESDGRGAPAATQPLGTQTITSIAASHAGDVWIGTSGRGIVVVGTAGATRRILHEASVATSLADDAPVTLFRDRGGALWVGSQRALSRYDPTRTGLWTLFGGTQRAGAISDQDILAVHAGADGRVWLGLGSKGVEVLDPATGSVSRFARRYRALLPPVPVSAFADLPDGRVAIGTNAGLFVSDGAGRTLAPLGGRERGHAREVTSLLREGATLWIGRLDGLWRLALDGPPEAHPIRVAASGQLGDQRVMTLARGPDGALWIGTQNGLNRLLPGGRVERIALTGTGSDGLVPSVLADRRGRIWASLYGHGLVLIEQPRHRPLAIRHIDVADGLPDANVDMLMEDGAGRIWASTDNGLAVVAPSGATVRALGALDGVAIAAYWNGAGARLANGQLLFGGLGGLTVVDPRRVPARPAPAPLVVTELRVGGKALPEGGLNDRAARRGVTISPRANSLFVEFATLDYADAGNMRYRYRLRGYQDEWTDADAAHRTAAFTNLTPGAYVLEVRAVTGKSAGAGADGLAIPVEVLAAWYQTLWFRAALGLLAVAAMLGVTHLRTAALHRRRRELERLVAERTTALSASQKELERIAYVDVLTGLPNRRKFNDVLRAAIAQADDRGGSLALLLIDLDHFKAVNDRHGHDAGDVLLSEVALKLRAEAGDGDDIARLGGDEFAIIVPDAHALARVDDLCGRITASLATPITFAGTTLRSGATIGIAVYRQDGATSAELYKASDVALYAAKRRRRGSWTWYSDDLVTIGGPAASLVDRRSRR